VEHEDPRAVLVHGGKVHYLAYDPTGRTLAAAAVGGLVKVWEADTGKKRSTLKGQARFVHAVCYSPDGRTLATAAGDGSVRFWDVGTCRQLRAFDWGVGPVESVTFAPDGMRAAAGGARDIIVWDIDDWGTER
jgi:WD40 repeat protein